MITKEQFVQQLLSKKIKESKMDGDQELFALFWKCATLVICTIAITIGSCIAYQSNIQSEVIAKSTNPALTSCSFASQEDMRSAFCVELAHKQ